MIPTWVIALVGGLAIALQHVAQHASHAQHAYKVLSALSNGGVGVGVSGGIAVVAKSLAKAFGKGTS